MLSVLTFIKVFYHTEYLELEHCATITILRVAILHILNLLRLFVKMCAMI